MAAPDEEFRVKSLTWHGRDTYMLMQGDNGPCPLLALCNVLLLRNSIALPRPGAPNVAQSELTALLAEYMLESNPVTEASPPDLCANLTDAMAPPSVDLPSVERRQSLSSPALAALLGSPARERSRELPPPRRAGALPEARPRARRQRAL